MVSQGWRVLGSRRGGNSSSVGTKLQLERSKLWWAVTPRETTEDDKVESPSKPLEEKVLRIFNT